MSDPQYKIKVWLRDCLKEMGHGSKSRLAEELGVRADAITRMTNLEDDGKEPRVIKAHELEVMAAFFGKSPPNIKPLYSTFDPDAESQDEDRDWEGSAVSHFGGSLHFVGRIKGSSPEIPAAAGAGQGIVLDDRSARVVTNGIASGHHVVNEWVIPPDFVRYGLGASPSQIVLIPVVGHSMEPRIFEGDRVMVDLSQATYVGDAVYVINDGDEVFKVKTVHKILGSKPTRFRIISEATPDKIDELDHDQFRFIGRVVGRFTRM